MNPYEGLNSKLFNPVDPEYFDGKEVEKYPVFPHANATDMPNPDPMEDYSNINYQLFGPEAPSRNPRWGNLGFVINYKKATGINIPVQIMEPFSPDQVPVISDLFFRRKVFNEVWMLPTPSGGAMTHTVP